MDGRAGFDGAPCRCGDSYGFQGSFYPRRGDWLEALLAAGSWSAAREKGTLRLEGKDYVVQDGDVMVFRV